MEKVKAFLPQRRKGAKENPGYYLAPLRLCGKLILAACLFCGWFLVNAQTPQPTPPPPAPPRSGTFTKPVEENIVSTGFPQCRKIELPEMADQGQSIRAVVLQ